MSATLLFSPLLQGGALWVETIRVDHVEALRAAVAKATVPTEIVRYADADHGFHCDARDSYDEASSKDAWSRTLAWFDANLPKR